jgi:hypothetical protein
MRDGLTRLLLLWETWLHLAGSGTRKCSIMALSGCSLEASTQSHWFFGLWKWPDVSAGRTTQVPKFAPAEIRHLPLWSARRNLPKFWFLGCLAFSTHSSREETAEHDFQMLAKIAQGRSWKLKLRVCSLAWAPAIPILDLDALIDSSGIHKKGVLCSLARVGSLIGIASRTAVRSSSDGQNLDRMGFETTTNFPVQYCTTAITCRHPGSSSCELEEFGGGMKHFHHVGRHSMALAWWWPRTIIVLAFRSLTPVHILLLGEWRNHKLLIVAHSQDYPCPPSANSAVHHRERSTSHAKRRFVASRDSWHGFLKRARGTRRPELNALSNTTFA